MDPVAAEALAELIASAVTAVAGRAWTAAKGTPEGRAVKATIGVTVSNVIRDSALPVGTAVDDAWVTEVDKIWRPAFTEEVRRHLVASMADPSGEAARQFAELARQALEDAGCDLAELRQTFWVEEFLAVLPRRVFDSLREASLRDPKMRALVEILLLQRGDARARGIEPPTPGEFRKDLIMLLRGLDEQARTGRLPAYLPAAADVTGLSRTVQVRLEVRSGQTALSVGRAAGSVYRLPVERAADSEPLAWPEVAAAHRRLIVLADPGLGKSWLIRTETHRLCRDALARLAEDPGAVVIPVPLRCDQLVAAVGQDLAGKAAAYLVAQGVLPQRSLADLAVKVRTGEAVVLLDALDELTSAENGQLRELVRLWADQTGDRTRCVITSRIAGYTGPPLPGVQEVELQPFTQADAVATLAAWRLPEGTAAQLRDQIRDPAIAAMARIPLLLALLCSLAARLPSDEALPRTRGQLYDRVLRWFLTRVHRSQDDPGAPALDDLEVEALLEILAPLAYTFATQPGGWTDLMPGSSLLNAIRAVGPSFTELHRPAAEVLRELSVGAGVLVPEGDPSAGRSPRYLFLHRTVAEYLTARYLATLPDADWLATVDQHRWFDPDWAEVIPMLGELLSPEAAQTLIQHILMNESDPFHQSLFIAARVWGVRPDSDDLLTSAQANKLAGRLDELLRYELTREGVTSHCANMTYLPRPLLTRLLARLTDENPRVREAAVSALASREGPGITEALLARLTDEDLRVRESAVRALAECEGPGITEALLGVIADDTGTTWHAPSVRSAAADALASREDPAITEALLARLTDEDPRVRESAVRIARAGQVGPDVTEPLLACLTDRDSEVRKVTALALATHGDPSVVEALLAGLAGLDFVTGAEAAFLLASREGTTITEALLDALAHQDSSVRAAAVGVLAVRSAAVGAHTGAAALHALYVRFATAKALADREHPALLAQLIEMDFATGAPAGWEDPAITEALVVALTDQDSSVRFATVRALASRKGPGVTEALLARLGDENPYVRNAAVRAVADRKGSAITQALLSCTADENPYVRNVAVRALPVRDGPALTETLLGRLTDQHSNVRAAAAWALADRKGPGVTEALLACLTDQHSNVRAAAAWALAGRKGPGVTEALLACLTDQDSTDQDSAVRCAAMRALAGREDPGVTEALLTRLTDQYPSVRDVAAEALAGREDPGVTTALLARLTDQDSAVRCAAAEALAGREDPGVTTALLACLTDQDSAVRCAAVRALAGREDPGVTEALVACLTDQDHLVRVGAKNALAGRQSPGVTTALVACLTDQDSAVRCAVAEALAGREDPGVTTALVARLTDQDSAVRYAAVRALADGKSPQALLSLGKEVQALSRSSLPEVTRTAEQLMIRHYLQVDPEEREEVRAAMAWLTTSVLELDTDESADRSY